MTAVTEYDSALEALLNSTEEMVTAAQIAPVLHMNPGVIIKYAKDGTWKPDIWGKFIISGERVKFFRRDFLQKCGFLPADPPEKTERQLLGAIRDAAVLIVDALCILMDPKQQEVFMRVVDDLQRKKEPPAAATTDG